MSDLTDADLYALTPAERRAIRGAARGGWVGSPGMAVCDAVEAKTGLRIQSEAIRGEPRAFWASNEALAVAIAARLDALPRRDLGRRSQAPR